MKRKIRRIINEFYEDEKLIKKTIEENIEENDGFSINEDLISKKLSTTPPISLYRDIK
ncbi:MAG: hypothetical protein HUJ68_01265 [Clostridia bacterium]|nr:hypothetical protein [Clostridia bacterium]